LANYLALRCKSSVGCYYIDVTPCMAILARGSTCKEKGWQVSVDCKKSPPLPKK